jgi:uncharacterized protein YicC (UPF0701 family)
MRVQADAQAAQMKAQLDGQMHQSKIQAEMQLAQMQAQIEDQKMQHEMAMKAQTAAAEDEFNRWKAELEAATKVLVARIGANPGVDVPLVEAATAASDRIASELGDNVQNALQTIAAMHQNMNDMQNATMEKMDNVMSAATAKKRIIRGPDGKAIGVEVVQ